MSLTPRNRFLSVCSDSQAFVGVFTSTGSLVTHSLQRAESSSAALDWTFAQLEVAAAGRVRCET